MSNENNPLLANLKMPGRRFQLPSRGLFYNEGEMSPDTQDGVIHVKPMSALDEINLKNPDQLFSGAAIDIIRKNCIEGLEGSNLLGKDVDALMLFLRVVTYGPNFEFIAKHNCEKGQDRTYVADVERMISTMKIIDPTTIEEDFKVTLPNGQVVKLRPNRYLQIVNLIKKNESKQSFTAKEQQENLVEMALGVIESVDGINDEALIREWLSHVSQPDINRIADKTQNINDWGPDLKWTCTCPDCGEKFTVDIPINPVSFFTE